MKPASALRSFLALGCSTLLAISYSHAQTILADSYLTSLDVTSNTNLYSSLNFNSILNGPLTGSFDLTHTGYFGSQLSLVGNSGNTFTGNIIVDSGTLRIAGSPFVSNGGFTAGSMTSSDTITIKRAGTLTIDDNVTGGYTANRFGSGGSRPAVSLAGGTINLNGLNNASSSVQTFGALTSSSGAGTINVTRNTNGNPTLTFSSLAISSGSLLTFNGTALGTGTNDSRITFTSSPTLTNGILAGARFYNGSPGTSELVTYGANGVTTFTAYDLSAADINGATSTQNVQIPLNATAAALTGDVTVNSLNFAGNANWSLGGNKLTIGSGMFLRNGTNVNPNITNGTLTAGDGVNDIDLNIIVAQENTTIQAVIADNALSAVTLVKSGDGRALNLTGGANNTYTGGTYVVGGTLATGNVANRTYLGTGQVTVDGASTLTLGAIGATSNSTGNDYTAINGGQINIATAAYTSSDTFDIKANSVISGAVGVGTGLNSLDRGIGGGTANITLATNSVIGHSAVLGAALNLSTGTIKNLGTSADLYYGLTGDQNNALGQITIGTGTAFKGISSVSSGARAWNLGTINVATGTTDVYFQGIPSPTAVPTLVAFGNGTTAGGPIVSLADAGTLNVNVLGSVQINDDAAVFGNSSTSRNVKFVVTEGSSLSIATATGMGSGTGIASATVKNGGTLTINNAASINGSVTIEAGGMFTQNQATLTGTGTFTHTAGSILNLTVNGTAVSGATQALGTVAGTIVRIGINPTSGTSSGGITQFDERLNDAAIYQLAAGITFTAAAAATDSLLTLNSSGGVGGILTNDLASRNTGGVAGTIKLGANGGLIAATTNTTLTLSEDLSGGALTIGTTDIIDGAPKLGTVILNVANTHTGGTTVNAGTLQLNNATSLGSTSGQLTVNTGGTLSMTGVAQTVGNLTGTGGIINAAGRILTIGQGDTGGGNYQGSIQGTNAALTKTGTGTITLSGVNTYTGPTTINLGMLKVSGSGTLGSGAALTLGGGALDLGTLSQTVGAVSVTAPAASGDTISNGSLTGTSYAASNTTGNAIISANLLVNGAAGFAKTGAGGTTTLSGTNTYTGATTVTSGTLATTTAVQGFGTNLSGISVGGSGTLSLLNDGTVSFTNGTSAYNIANSASGATINVDRVTGTGSNTITVGNLTTSSTAVTWQLNFTGATGVGLNAGALTTPTAAAGVHTISNNILGGGSLTLASVAGGGTGATATLIFTGSANTTVAGAITQAATAQALRKDGGGTLTLNGSSAFTGITTINAGVVEAATLASGGSNSSIGRSSNAAANLVFGAPTATLRYTGTSNVTIDRGFTTSSTPGGGATIESSGSGTLSFSGGPALAYATSNQTRTLTLGGTNAGANTFGKVIANNGSEATSLAKTGDGTWVLDQANTYTGATTISGGILVINGTQTLATGTVTVNDGGTLGGIGIVGGTLTVNSGGTHAPGNSPGIQTINAATTYETGSIFAWDLAANKDTASGGVRGTDYDGVTINSSLTVQDGVLFRVIQNVGLDFADAFWTQSRVWSDIFNVTGAVTGWATNTAVGVYNTSNVPQDVSAYGSFTISGTSLSWNFSAVPEPTSALAGLLLGAGLLRRRRTA